MTSQVSGSRFLIHPYQTQRPVDWEHQFGRLAGLEVEIGSGLGEFMTRRARENPGLNFLGIENNWERVFKSLRNLGRTAIIDLCTTNDKKKPESKGRDTDYINIGKEKVSSNARILPTDARLVFQRFLLPSSISMIHCLFPCPWPKKGHAKHRLFSRDFLCLLNSRLVSGGQLRIVTDHYPYVEWIRSQVPVELFRLEQKTIPPQFDTKFERKWFSLGQKEFFELQLFKIEHIDIPLLKDTALKNFSLKSFRPERFSFRADGLEAGSLIVFKEYFYDPKKFTGLVHVLVVEKEMTQHLWISIVKKTKVWMMTPLKGSGFIPTPGVEQAMELVYEEARKTVDG